MTTIKINLEKDEIEMLLHCIESAIDVVDLTNEEKARVEKLRDALLDGLKKQ